MIIFNGFILKESIIERFMLRNRFHEDIDIFLKNIDGNIL
jgi:hypothetical protein